MDMPEINKNQLRTLAELAGLNLSEERLEYLLPQMQSIIDSVDKLDELNLGDTPPSFNGPTAAQ